MRRQLAHQQHTFYANATQYVLCIHVRHHQPMLACVFIFKIYVHHTRIQFPHNLDSCQTRVLCSLHAHAARMQNNYEHNPHRTQHSTTQYTQHICKQHCASTDDDDDVDPPLKAVRLALLLLSRRSVVMAVVDSAAVRVFVVVDVWSSVALVVGARWLCQKSKYVHMR